MSNSIAARWRQWVVASTSILSSPFFSLPHSSSSLSSWQQYIRSPESIIVQPVSVLPGSITGNVTNPNGLVSALGEITTLFRAVPPSPPSWPDGTVANASSYHSANVYHGQPRTYVPSNAIDGDVTTFWNDDTLGRYPDILTIIVPDPIKLPGITVLSGREGVPIDFKVEVLQGNGSWVAAGTVTNNDAVQIRVPFSKPFKTSGVRITVTQDQAFNSGEFTRINEVWPGIVDDPPSVPSLVVDFGQPVVGFLSIAFAGASENAPGIRLAFAEILEYLTDVSDFTRSFNGDAITQGTDQISVSEKPYMWTDSHGCSNGSKVCADGLHGFRYVKISLDALPADSPDTSPYGFVSIDSLYLNFTAYLGTADTFTGWFECSDTTLNQLWYDAAYTNDMCIDTFRLNDTEPRNAGSESLLGKLVIHDGPKRDRDPYVGDLAVSARTLYLTHNASIAARNVLADLADHQRSDGWIPPASIGHYSLSLFDYPLWWVTTSYDLFVYTGDENYVREYYSTLVKVLDEFYTSTTDPKTGLLSKGLGGTAGYGDYAFLPRTGIVTYYNALYVIALRNAANIARFLKHKSDEKRWSKRADRVSDAVNAVLWDSTVGAYLDSVGSHTHGQDGNGLAILARIANNTRATAVLSYWSTLALPYGNPFFDNDALSRGFSQRVYPFISYFEIAARFESGLGDSGIEEIKRLYGWMAAHDPGTTFWEGIGTGGGKYEGGYTSAAHGWSTGVLPALTNYVLGVTPQGPGFSLWQIKPVMTAGISWARGQVPTPRGPVAVNWQNGASEFRMDFEAPDGTEGDVTVPASREAVIVKVDDLVVWSGAQGHALDARSGDGCITFHIAGGKHRVSVS